MKGAAELTVFMALSAAVHASVLFGTTAGTDGGAGQGGEATATLTAQTGNVGALIEAWQSAPEMSTTSPELAPPLTQAAQSPAAAEMAQPVAAAAVPPDIPAQRPIPQDVGPERPILRATAPSRPTISASLPDHSAPYVPQETGVIASITPTTPQRPASSLAPPLPIAATMQRHATPEQRPGTALAVATSPRPAPRLADRPTPNPEPIAPAQQSPTERAAQAPPPAPEVAARVAAGQGAGDTSGSVAQAPAQTGLSTAQRQSLVAQWAAQIQGRIERARPRVDGSGAVVLHLTIGRDGRLAALALARGSGNAALDQAATRAVQQAGRFPAAPDGLTDATYAFSLPIRFR